MRFYTPKQYAMIMAQDRKQPGFANHVLLGDAMPVPVLSPSDPPPGRALPPIKGQQMAEPARRCA